MSEPIPFVDLATWRTSITADGKTTEFAGRPKPGFKVTRLIRPGGITSITSRRVVTERGDPVAAVGKSRAQLMGEARRLCDSYRRDFPSIPALRSKMASQLPSKPMTSSERKYTVTFDGHPTTKPVEIIADGYNESGTGEFEFKLDGKLVAFHRFVKSVTAEDLPPTIEELQAEIAALKNPAEGQSNLLMRKHALEQALRDIRDEACKAKFGGRAAALREIVMEASRVLQ